MEKDFGTVDGSFQTVWNKLHAQYIFNSIDCSNCTNFKTPILKAKSFLQFFFRFCAQKRLLILVLLPVENFGTVDGSFQTVWNNLYAQYLFNSIDCSNCDCREHQTTSKTFSMYKSWIHHQFRFCAQKRLLILVLLPVENLSQFLR